MTAHHFFDTKKDTEGGITMDMLMKYFAGLGIGIYLGIVFMNIYLNISEIMKDGR